MMHRRYYKYHRYSVIQEVEPGLWVRAAEGGWSFRSAVSLATTLESRGYRVRVVPRIEASRLVSFAEYCFSRMEKALDEFKANLSK